jgi:hypothetical protein
LTARIRARFAADMRRWIGLVALLIAALVASCFWHSDIMMGSSTRLRSTGTLIP